MRKFFLTVLIQALGLTIVAQTTSPPQTTPNPHTSNVQRSTDATQSSRPRGGVNDYGYYDNLITYSKRMQMENADTLYRKPNSKELKLLATDDAIFTRYKDFLTAPNSGIFRLMPYLGCSEDTRIVTVTDTCQKYSMPGAGRSFSFRTGFHRISRLSDLIYGDDEKLLVGGKLTLSMIADLGDKNIENLTVESEGIKEFREFIPAANYDDALKQYQKIGQGYTVNNVKFSRKAKVAENTTYVFRTIAYRTKYYITIGGILPYNEFEYDKRTDVLVAFRIVKKDADGSLTVVWKEFERKESPKMNFRKDFDGKTIEKRRSI